jgi:hypothetical protein
MPLSPPVPTPDNGIAHAADEGHLPDIMHPYQIGPVEYAYGKRGRRPLQQRLTVRAKHIAYKRLAGSPDQDWTPQCLQAGTLLSQVRPRLAESDAGVDYPVAALHAASSAICIGFAGCWASPMS